MKAMKLLAASAAIAAAMGAAIPATAQSIYQITGNVSEGATIDLTAMSGYYADRIYGPSSSGIQFKGTFICDPSVSAENPFQLIGNGKQFEVLAATTGFETLPLKLYNAAGKTGTSTFKLSKGTYSGGSLDIGRYNRFLSGYNAGWGGGEGVLLTPTINVHDGGQMTADYRLCFAVNMPASISVTNGASISASGGIRLGLQNQDVSTPVTVFLGITNATVTAGGTAPNDGKAFIIMYNGANWNVENTRIVIGGESGLLRANCISHYSAGNSRISFDGGSYKPTTSSETASLPLFHVRGYISWASSKYPEPHMTVEGINGHPIDVENALDRDLSGGSNSGNRQINFTGTGGFTKRGAGLLTFNRLNNKSTCDYTGPTAVLGGGLLVTDAAFKPGRGALTVADGAFLDLNSFSAEFSGAAGSGLVSNRSATVSTLTLGYGNADGVFTVEIGERVNVVKTGTGTLTVSGAALANTCDFTVSAGTVVFAADSLSYGTVTVESGATLDAHDVEFECAHLVKRPGSTVLRKPKGTTIIIR